MTEDEKRDALEVFEIADQGYEDGIELLHLIEVMECQNKDDINAKLTAADAGGAAIVVRNGVLSRIVLLVAGAYAKPRPGDLQLSRAFELLKQTEVRKELERRGAPTLLEDAVKLWRRNKGDNRLERVTHFRDKFTAHRSKPRDIPKPQNAELFGFARDTIKLMDVFARGTGARDEPLLDWQAQAADSAERFWSVWK